MRRAKHNQPHFCVLAYKDQGKPLSANGTLTPVAVVVLEENTALKIYLHPKLTEIVKTEDQTYMVDIFNDICDRSKWDACGLFAQLCDLSVGPLVTERVGVNLKDDMTASRTMAEFRKI